MQILFVVHVNSLRFQRSVRYGLLRSLPDNCLICIQCSWNFFLPHRCRVLRDTTSMYLLRLHNIGVVPGASRALSEQFAGIICHTGRYFSVNLKVFHMLSVAGSTRCFDITKEQIEMKAEKHLFPRVICCFVSKRDPC